jgi:DNA-binding response OmpR family regulator
MSSDEIAIIDDDQQWVAAAARKLTDEGYLVLAATDAIEGGDLLARETPPALVVLDLQLPGFSGLHLLADFRRRNAFTPVLVVSSNDRASLRDEALSTGANGFLQKPLPPALLLSAIRRFLGIAAARAHRCS